MVPRPLHGDSASRYGEHLWYGGTVAKKATASADGEMVYKCTGCDATRTEVIKKFAFTAKAGKKVYTLKAKKLKKKAQTVKSPVKVTNGAKTKVTTAANDKYEAAAKTVAVKVKVK